MYRRYTLNSRGKESSSHSCLDNELPIHSAIRRGPEVVIKVTNEESTCLVFNATDADKNTPLHIAVERGYDQWVDYLLFNKGDPNVVNQYGLTPLMLAMRHGHPRLVLLMVSHGANVNYVNHEGQSALHYGACSGNPDCVEYLLQQKPKVNQQDHDGVTPLIMACKMQFPQIVRLLLSHKSIARINPNLCDKLGRTPLHWAAEVGDAESTKEMLKMHVHIDAKDDDMETPFVRTIKKNHLEVMDVLIDGGCDRSDIDGLNGTAMTMAGILGRYHIMQRLIDVGEDVNEVGHIGFTPLAAAVFECNVECVNLLLNSGADPNFPCRSGTTPLIKACTYMKGCSSSKRHEIVKLLLRANGDPNIPVTSAGFFTHVTNGRNCALSFAIVTGYLSLVQMMLIGGTKVTINDITDWIRINEIEKQDKIIYVFQQIHSLIKDPESLKSQCRKLIRQCLGFMVHMKVQSLPLPSIMQSYVNLEELDSIQISTLCQNESLCKGFPSLQRTPCGLRSLQGTLAYKMYWDIPPC